MRKSAWVILIVATLFSARLWALNGDMGIGTQPLTNGSEAYPWLIEDLADFDVFAGNSAYWAAGVHTKLMTDLDLAGRTYTRAVIAPNTGTSTNFSGIPYGGVYEGNNFTIFSLMIHTNGINNDFLALFGKISGSGAVVRNLNMTNIAITGGIDSDMFGGGVRVQL